METKVAQMASEEGSRMNALKFGGVRARLKQLCWSRGRCMGGFPRIVLGHDMCVAQSVHVIKDSIPRSHRIEKEAWVNGEGVHRCRA